MDGEKSCPEELATEDASTQSHPKAPTLPPGAPRSPVADRFDLRKQLGSGANGVVYEAFDTRLRRRVALKVLIAASADARERFVREGPSLAAVHHKGVAVVYDAGETADGRPYIAIEYVDGRSLAETLKKGPLPVAEAVRVADAVADALGAVHAAGVLHRDLKPGNVMIAASGDVKVLDFGLAKSKPAESHEPLTASGTVLGTPHYMSPEQVDAKDVDERADIWSWGCALFEMLSGNRAFTGATLQDVLVGVTSREPDWLALPADVPSGIVRLLRECLAKDRDRRPRDMTAVRQQLLAAMAVAPEISTAPARIDSSAASRRFRALLQHVQNVDVADAAAAAVLEAYARSLREGIKAFVDDGVLSPDSTVSVKTSPGLIFALSAGFRAPLVPGGALTFRIGVSDSRMYAALEGHVQVEIPEPTGTSLQVRWMPVREINTPAEVVARFPLADVLPLPLPSALNAISAERILVPAMDLLLERAEAQLISRGYKLPVAAATGAREVPSAPRVFQQLDAPARDLLVAIIAEMHPREDFHEFWAVGTFGGWQLLLVPRRDSQVGQKTLDERSGKFELTDLENLQAHGYVRLQARGRSEYRGTVTTKAFAEYDVAVRNPLVGRADVS